MFGFLMGTLQKFKADEDSAKTSDKVPTVEPHTVEITSGQAFGVPNN